MNDDHKKQQADALLAKWRKGDQGAFNELFSLLHSDFKKDAHHRVRRERQNLTLQTGDLVNKLYLKMAQSRNIPWQDLTHFEKSAATTMKHLLIDHARGWLRRGDGKARVHVDNLDEREPQGPMEQPERLLQITEAMEQMEALDPTMTRIFGLKHLLGLTHDEIAEELDLPINKVKRDWQIATRFMNERLARK